MSLACKHCGESIPKSIKNEFCCSGCEGAYTFIENAGLKSYYSHQQFSENIRPIKPEEMPEISWFTPFVSVSENTSTLHLMIEGVHCAACVWLIEQTLRRIEGVEKAQLNMGTRRMAITWRSDQVNLSSIIETIYTLGYVAMPYDPFILKAEQKREEKALLISMAVAGFAAGNIMAYSVSLWAGKDMTLATHALFTWMIALISLPTIAYAGRHFFKSAYKALKAGRVNMDVPIALAISTATGLSIYEMLNGGETYFDGCITLLFFLLVGRYLDTLMRGKARSHAESLLLLDNSMVTRKKNNGDSEIVPIKQVVVGDILLISKGEKIAVDVEVIEGVSQVETSALTGETYPLDVKMGEKLAAGYQNLTAPLVCRVVAVGEKSALHILMKTIEDAENTQNKYTRWADYAAKIYVPVVHALALATFLFWGLGMGVWYMATVSAIAVLIVTCPCAFALAVPSAMAASSSVMLKKGILLKNADALEKSTTLKHIVFDKTGTLTTGTLLLENIKPEDLDMATALAAYSSHPLSRAVLKAGNGINHKPQLSQVEEITGQGVKAMHNGEEVRLGSAEFCATTGTGLFLKVNGESVPLHFEDHLKPHVEEVLAKLSQKYQLHLLTGDSKPLNKQIKALPFTSVKQGANPTDKQNALTELQKTGKVMMVGDGINDSPALSVADVAVSFAGATALAQTMADVVLTRKDDMFALYDFINISKRTKRTVQQNFGFSISYNFIAVPMAMTGHMSPMWAAIFMSGSSLVVVLNALRLKRPLSVKK